MPLANFIRDRKYFTNFRDNRQIMQAADFDDQFNATQAYINNNFVSFVNNIAAGAGAGSFDNPGAFLRNVGDGTTVISYIASDDIVDYSFEFSKLTRAAVASTILAVDVNQTFVEVGSNIDNNILFSTLNNLPTWRTIVAADIDNNTIGGQQIGNGVLNNEHLQPGVTAGSPPDGTVLGRNFADYSISNGKYLPGSFEPRNFGILINALPARPPGTSYLLNTVNLARNVLTYDKLQDGSVTKNSFYQYQYNKAIITPNKVAPQTIDDSFLVPLTALSTGFFSMRSLTSREITAASMIKTMFEYPVQQAFTAKGL
jgi:hypothetical protein